jgi:hypothetical protein
LGVATSRMHLELSLLTEWRSEGVFLIAATQRSRDSPRTHSDKADGESYHHLAGRLPENASSRSARMRSRVSGVGFG